MDGPETSEAKADDKGESEEAAAEIESDGRRNEIADELTVSAFKPGPFLIYTINLHDVPPGRPCACAGENIL